jgi:heme a synthase
MTKKIWLSVFVVLTLIMIAVGGTTRLTRSGLSIVEWKPVSGIIPPITEQQWQTQFELYKQSPQFSQVNSHFELSDYKKIFFWEYVHRLLGRILFLFALIPGLVLWRRKKIKGAVVVQLTLLVALQGLVGWLMVKTGLNRDPQVSPYMLALHFFSALLLLLVAYYHLKKDAAPLTVKNWRGKQQNTFIAFAVLLFLQVFYGNLTSGFKAAFAFNTFPFMGGTFLPPGGLGSWLSDPATIQWTHRWLGFLVLLFAILFVHFAKQSGKALRGPTMHLFGVVLLQVALGVFNLVYAVPTWLGVLHQVNAVLVILALFNLVYRIKTA